MDDKRPKVGLGVIIERDGKILVGKRLSSHGAGNWEIAGGHLEFGETFEEGAIREATEETGITDLEPVGIVSLSNDIEYDKHYIAVGVHLRSKSGEPTNPEPEHSSDWYWCDPRDLPQPFLPSSQRVVTNWLSGTIYKSKK